MTFTDMFIYVDFTLKSAVRIEISNYQNGVRSLSTFDLNNNTFIDCLSKALQDYKTALLSNEHMLNHFKTQHNEQTN